MTDNKKKRLSMLDNLTNSGSPAPQTPAMTQNRALRAARDAVDGHHVWDLDPWSIEDMRPTDRLDPSDFADLKDAIEENGQTVPILVRRKPGDPDRYLLVYGRRRLEAIRASEKVDKIRALIASLDDQSAIRAQISENMARRDLSFIEKALFARELVDSGFGNQGEVADVLTVTKSSVSMALSVVDAVTPDLAKAIGPAHGIGRPRWEALARSIQNGGIAPSGLVELANSAWAQAEAVKMSNPGSLQSDPSVVAFESVADEVERSAPITAVKAPPSKSSRKKLNAGGQHLGTLRSSDVGLRIDITDRGFATWLEEQADTVIEELHARWKSGAEGKKTKQ